MAEISFNNKYNQMNKLNQQFYDSYFEDKYDSTKPMDQQSNSLTMKSLGDGSTTPDFAAMQSAYADAQKSKTKNSFFSMSADAAMPDNFSGLQNSMGGLTLNPDGTLNYNNTQPQNLGFTSMVDMANKANNFNSQFASPGRFSGMGQVGPNKSNMNAPTALDMDRFAGVSNLGRNDMDVEQVESLTSPQGILQGLQDKIGAGFNNVKDFAMDKGRMGRNLLGSAGAMALGLPGIVGSGAMALMGGMGNQFADKTLYGDTIDENGNVYSADQLNSQNALGGGYTDPARSARRRMSRINNMKAREAAGKRISRKNLERLQAQEAAAQQARQAATTQMARDNSKDNTGGYQAGYSSSFMGGSGTAADMGSFRDGGLASMFTRRR